MTAPKKKVYYTSKRRRQRRRNYENQQREKQRSRSSYEQAIDLEPYILSLKLMLVAIGFIILNSLGS
jgi:hypothetical protein